MQILYVVLLLVNLPNDILLGHVPVDRQYRTVLLNVCFGVNFEIFFF